MTVNPYSPIMAGSYNRTYRYGQATPLQPANRNTDTSTQAANRTYTAPDAAITEYSANGDVLEVSTPSLVQFEATSASGVTNDWGLNLDPIYDHLRGVYDRHRESYDQLNRAISLLGGEFNWLRDEFNRLQEAFDLLRESDTATDLELELARDELGLARDAYVDARRLLDRMRETPLDDPAQTAAQIDRLTAQRDDIRTQHIEPARALLERFTGYRDVIFGMVVDLDDIYNQLRDNAPFAFVPDILVSIRNEINDIVTAINRSVDTLMDQLFPMLDETLSEIAEMEQIVTDLEDAIDRLEDDFDEITEGIENQISELEEAIAAEEERIEDAIGELEDEFDEWLAGMNDRIDDATERFEDEGTAFDRRLTRLERRQERFLLRLARRHEREMNRRARAEDRIAGMVPGSPEYLRARAREDNRQARFDRRINRMETRNQNRLNARLDRLEQAEENWRERAGIESLAPDSQAYQIAQEIMAERNARIDIFRAEHVGANPAVVEILQSNEQNRRFQEDMRINLMAFDPIAQQAAREAETLRRERFDEYAYNLTTGDTGSAGLIAPDHTHYRWLDRNRQARAIRDMEDYRDMRTIANAVEVESIREGTTAVIDDLTSQITDLETLMETESARIYSEIGYAQSQLDAVLADTAREAELERLENAAVTFEEMAELFLVESQPNNVSILDNLTDLTRPGTGTGAGTLIRLESLMADWRGAGWIT